MSFSSDIKNELVKIKNTNSDVLKSELTGAVAFGGKFRHGKEGLMLQIATENAKVARRIYQLLKEALGIASKIKIHKTKRNNAYYQVYVQNRDVMAVMMKLGFLSKPSDANYFTSLRVNTAVLDRPSKRKAFLRGAFLACGSVMTPEKKYHMEFSVSTYGLHNDLFFIMKQLGLNPKTVIRKNSMVVYFKNSDEIADILTIMGAYTTLMQFHNTKILKEIRNNVNRTVNCEAANMQITVDASVEQVRAIKKLIDNNMFDTLPDNLKEVARLRLEYREHSLKELGEMLNPPLGKSGVNHRLRKIQEIADKC